MIECVHVLNHDERDSLRGAVTIARKIVNV
jgi:hypothetical protein